MDENNQTVRDLPVLAKHEDTQGPERRQSVDLLDLVVIEVEEDETTQSVHILNPTDCIVLEIQQAQLVLGLQCRTRCQTTPATSQ